MLSVSFVNDSFIALSCAVAAAAITMNTAIFAMTTVSIDISGDKTSYCDRRYSVNIMTITLQVVSVTVTLVTVTSWVCVTVTLVTVTSWVCVTLATDTGLVDIVILRTTSKLIVNDIVYV